MAGNESKIIMDFIIRGIGDAKKQIEDVRKAIKSLSGTVTRTSTGLNNINEGLNKIGKSGKLAGKSLDDASKSTRKANVSFREMGQAIGDIGRGLALMGAAATAALAVSAKEAIKFEEAMYNINAIAKVSTHELKMMADGARELAKRLDVKDTATGVAQAMHTLVLSGIESSKALDIAGVSAKAAAAGMSDTKTAVKALSALMNSYNKKTVQDSITFSDQLFKIVERGVLTFEGLAENLGAVVAIASPMGVAFEEVGAAYIELTRSGISVAEAETAIASLLRQLGAPSKTAKKNAAELGLEIGDVALKTKGLNGMLFELMEATGGSEEAIKSIIPDWRGMKALLALTKNEGLAYADSLREMKNAQDGVGATQKALNEQMKSTAFQLAQLNAYWTDLKIELGNILTEIAMPFIQFMKSLIAGFTALPDGLQKAIVIVGLLTAGLGALGAALSVISFVLPPLILVFGKIAGAFSMAYAESSIVYAAFWKLVSVVTTLNPAILAMVAVFTGWLAILTAIYNIFPAFAEKVDWLGGILKNYLIGNLQLLGDKLGWLKDKFFELIDAIQFWADNKASDKAAKIELENAKKITNGIKELTEEGTKQKKQRLKDIEEEYKARVESLKKNKKLTDEFRNAQIKAAKERYEIQKDIIERSDVLTVEQIKKIRDSYQVLADRSTNPRARNRNLADWKKWNDRLIAEEQLRLSLGDEAKQRTEKRLTGFGGVDVKAEKDDYDKLAKMYRDAAADILKTTMNVYEHKKLLSAYAYADEVENIQKLKVADKHKNDLIEEAYKKHLAKLEAIRVEEIQDERKKALKIQKLEEGMLNEIMKQYLADEEAKLKAKEDSVRNELALNKQKYEQGEIFAEEYFNTERVLLYKLMQVQDEQVLFFFDNKKKQVKAEKDVAKTINQIHKNSSEKTQKMLEFEASLWQKATSLVQYFGNTLKKSSNEGIASLGSFIDELVGLKNHLSSLVTPQATTGFKKMTELFNKVGPNGKKIFDITKVNFKDLANNADVLAGVFSIAMTITQEWMASIGELFEAFEMLNKAFEDGEVSASEWNKTALQTMRVIPFIGDAMADLTNSLQNLVSGVLEWMGFLSGEELLDKYIVGIQRAEDLENKFRADYDRHMNDKERAVEQFYKEYEYAINKAYETEKDAIDNNIKDFENKIDGYKDAIDDLQDKLDELKGDDFKREAYATFSSARADILQGLDPDFYRDPITHFELTQQEIQERLEAAYLKGQISLKDMNDELMYEAIRRNIYYTEMASDLEDGTREQFEYIQMANDAYEDYADLLRSTEELKLTKGDISTGALGIEDYQNMIKSEEALMDQEQARLDELTNSYDIMIEKLDSQFKDMWGNFKIDSLDAIDSAYQGLMEMANLLVMSGAPMGWSTIGQLGAAQTRTQSPVYGETGNLTLSQALSDSIANGSAVFQNLNTMMVSLDTLHSNFSSLFGETYDEYLTRKSMEGFAKGGVADQPSIFGEAGPEAAFTAQQVKGMYDYIVSSTMGGGSGGGLTINVGQVVANNPQEFTKQLKSNMPYIQKQLGKSYRNAYAN